MKLLELRNTTPARLIDELLKSNLFKKELGRGQRGIAFELNDKTVVKAWVGDPGYDAWIEYAKNNPSPFFIKVLSPVKTLKLEFYDVKYVKLEKLEKRNGVFDGFLMDNKLMDICGYLNEERYPPFMTSQEIWDKIGVKPTAKWIAFTNKIIELAEQMLSEGFELDLNKNNIGRRHNSNLPVIMDALHANLKIFGQELVDIDQILVDKVH